VDLLSLNLAVAFVVALAFVFATGVLVGRRRRPPQLPPLHAPSGPRARVAFPTHTPKFAAVCFEHADGTREHKRLHRHVITHELLWRGKTFQRDSANDDQIVYREVAL
jgi:hypothetical protein